MCQKNTTTICNTDFFADKDDYYTLHDYSMTISIGQSLKCFKLNITDDSSVEENETLTLSLAKPTGSQFKFDESSSAAIVLIKDDESKFYLYCMMTVRKL